MIIWYSLLALMFIVIVGLAALTIERTEQNARRVQKNIQQHKKKICNKMSMTVKRLNNVKTINKYNIKKG